MKRVIALLISLSAIATSAWGQQPACGPDTAAASKRIDDIKTRYIGLINKEQQDLKNGIQQIQNDAPDTSGAAGKIGMDIELRDNLREIRFDLPQVTMKTQKMSMDLPQVTMKTQAWSWDVPEVVMVQECHAGPDEVVGSWGTCHSDFGSFDYPCWELHTRRGPDICYSLPSTRMRRDEVKFDVPEVTMGRTEWALDVPEVTMRTQTIKINIPDIVVKNIKVEMEKQQKEASELSMKAKNASAGITNAMTKEISGTSKELVSEAFSCQRQQLETRMRDAYEKIRVTESTITASYNQAQQLKATDLIGTYEKALQSLKESKEKMLKDYVKIRRDMREQENKAINQVTAKAN